MRSESCNLMIAKLIFTVPSVLLKLDTQKCDFFLVQAFPKCSMSDTFGISDTYCMSDTLSYV